jgi:hypothetical protein
MIFSHSLMWVFSAAPGSMRGLDVIVDAKLQAFFYPILHLDFYPIFHLDRRSTYANQARVDLLCKSPSQQDRGR